MSESALTLLGALELVGLVGLFMLIRREGKRRAAGQPRAPRAQRIAAALLGLVVVVAFPAIMIVSIMNPSLQTDRLHKRLVETGTRATATITDIEETGTVINHRPQVRVELTVEPQGAASFASQSTWVFTVKDSQTYRVGSKVDVYFDPQDHGAVAVVGLAPSSGP